VVFVEVMVVAGFMVLDEFMVIEKFMVVIDEYRVFVYIVVLVEAVDVADSDASVSEILLPDAVVDL
jgi:hypothetical protein